MQHLNEFKRYISKLRYVEAVQVDEKWAEFLRKEHGYTSVKVGDYYVKQCDGNYIVLTDDRFNRLFEIIKEEVDLLDQANKVLDHLVETGNLSGE